MSFFDLISPPEYAKFHRYGIEGNQHTIENGILIPNPLLNVRETSLKGNAVGHELWGGMFGSLALEEWDTLRVPFLNTPHVISKQLIEI